MDVKPPQQEVPLYSISADINDKQEPTSSSLVKRICQRFHEHSGIWYMVSANLMFASCTFALKSVPADMLDIMIIRFLLQSIVFGIFAAFYKRYNIFATNGQPLACALNVSMSSATNFTYIAAYYFLPLADLNTIKYTYIVWAAILAVIFLKERFKLVNLFALFFTFAGLVLATKPQLFLTMLSHVFNVSASTSINGTDTVTTAAASSPYFYFGVALASVSALAKAIQMIARKQLVRTKQPYSVMNFQFTLAGLFVSTVYSIARRFWQPEPYAWKWMIIAGSVFGCCQLVTNTFLAKALKRENVQLLSILGSLDIVYAVLLQYIFFRQTKSSIFYLGATLIVTSAIILSVDRDRSQERERKKALDNENPNDTSKNLI